MSRATNKYLQYLKRHIWLLAAFFIPLAIRSIPEILSWPYLLGFDTLTVVNRIHSGIVLSSPIFFIHNQLFYSFATFLNFFACNTILVLKVCGPLLMGLVCVAMFLYAKHGLGWSSSKSFLVSLMVAIYFVTLRNSWDLYSQSFGLVFMLCALVIIKSKKSIWRFPFAFIFMFLTVLSHELISVLMFFVLVVEAFRLLHQRKRQEFSFLLICLTVAGFVYYFRLYSPNSEILALPAANVASASTPTIDLFYIVSNLIIYCYFLIAPFTILGFLHLKDWTLKLWFLWCLIVPLILVVLPNLPLYYWNRWVYLLAYPLLFFLVEGLDQLWRFGSNNKVKLYRIFPKAIALIYVILLIALSGFYMAADPRDQIGFFSTDNPSLAFIPSSMLQNTVPISDNPSMVACFNWVDHNAHNDSVLVVHYALYDLATIYAPHVQVLSVIQNSSMVAYLQNETSLEDGITENSQIALAQGYSTVYSVWWINSQDSWYGIPSLPNGYTIVFQSGLLAVFKYNPN